MKPWVVPDNRRPQAGTYGDGSSDMRVMLSTYGSRGDVEPMVALAVQLRVLGAEVRVCAPPDFEDLLARVGVPLVPAGGSVRQMVREVLTRSEPPSPADLPRRAAELLATQFDAVAAAADGCDALVASGITPAVAAARAVAEIRGIRWVHATHCPVWLPSPHHRPLGLPGRPLPPDVTDNRVLWDLEAQGMNAVFGAPTNACAGSPTHRR
jgi:vancomycin aglycone glucosyltransferase